MTPVEPAAPGQGDKAVSPRADLSSWPADRLPPSSLSKSMLVDWALEEYYRCAEEGDPPDVEAYCAHFPACRSALLRVLGLGRFVDNHPDFLASGRDKVPWPTVGEERGDLTILRPLGRGAFSRVFLAAEASTGDRLVAVKFSLRGEAEARTLGRLSHPNIVPILSARLEESTGLTITCMPYLGSATLEDVLDRVCATAPAEKRPQSSLLRDVLRTCAQPEDPPATLDPRLRSVGHTDAIIHLARPLAEALAFLHARGVCHRDLKPSNILLDPTGKPLLLDFNLSTSEQEPSVPNGGTLRYAAPEQLRVFLEQGGTPPDERSDLFSLGVILYELLSGVHPFGPIPAEPNERSLASHQLERVQCGFRPVSQVCPNLERPVAQIIDRCLAFDPAKRPHSAEELILQLRRQFSPARRLRRWAAGRPRTVAAALGLFLAAGIAAGYAWSVTPPYSEREHQLGVNAYRGGQYDEAEQHFDLALQSDPGNARLRFARGCARLKQSEYQPGNKDKLDQAWRDLKPDPETPMDPPAIALYAYVQSRMQNAREAIAGYNAIPAGYRPLMVLNNRAYCYLLRKNFRDAHRDLEEAGRWDPDCQAVYYNRALLALAEIVRQPGAVLPSIALEDIENALRIGPATPDLYRDAAMLHDRAAADDLRALPQVIHTPFVTALLLHRHQQRAGRAVDRLREAVANGESLDLILKGRRFPLATLHPAFKELRHLPTPRSLPRRELRLIDPIELPD